VWELTSLLTEIKLALFAWYDKETLGRVFELTAEEIGRAHV